jgi:AbiV family abortive infection protein
MLKVNLKKLEKMEEMSFKNALRLHFDSTLLFKEKSYPSAFFLSILSQEEIGKAYLLSDFVFHSVVDKTKLSKKETEKWFGLLYKHPVKQGTFFQNSIFTSQDIYRSNFKFLTRVFGGELDVLKQNSVYVGLERKKGKINIGGKIKSPFKINRAKTKKQITMINDYLTDLIIGIRYQYYSWDNENVSKLLNKRLFNKLESSWGHKSKKAERRIKNVKKQLKIKSIFDKH